MGTNTYCGDYDIFIFLFLINIKNKKYEKKI